MEGYFLIARNRKNNCFEVLKLNEKSFLGRSQGKDSFSRLNDLEAIDLVTTRFASEEEMAERMAKNGFIPDSDVDIFIASKRTRDGKNYIKFDEVIYATKNIERIANFRKMAYKSLRESMDIADEELAVLYDDVIIKTYFSDALYSMIMEGDTNIPCDFAEQLREIPMASDIPYELKNRENFGVSSYYTARSVVESLNRLDILGCSAREDIVLENLSNIDRNQSDRVALIPELFVQLDEDYVEGQMSLFSLLDEEKKEKLREAAKKVVNDTKRDAQKITIDRKASDKEKRKTIYSVLRRAPRNTFYKDEDGLFRVNYGLFTQPMHEADKKKLNTYLTGKLPKYFADYILNYGMLCDAQKDSFTPGSELAELQREVEYDVQKINNRFKSTKCLNMAYEWCVIFDAYMKKEAAYGAGASQATVGEEHGKTFRKK